MKPPYPVGCLVGPTASGKTSVVCQLPPDRVEIISADSIQAYRGMDIGTAKPPATLRKRIPHHLIDILDPNEQYSAAEFVRKCEELIPAICARGKVPVIVGGTAFYIRALLYGLPDTPAPEPNIREQLKQDLKQHGALALHKRLEAVDAQSAAQIHDSDSFRVIRALEIYMLTGKKRSEFRYPEQLSERYLPLIVGIRIPYSGLCERIHARCKTMFAAGLADEVTALIRQGYTSCAPGMRAIGYKEFLQCREFTDLQRICNNDILYQIRKKITYNCQQYAKRQITFFSRIKEISWFKDNAVAEQFNAVVHRQALLLSV